MRRFAPAIPRAFLFLVLLVPALLAPTAPSQAQSSLSAPLSTVAAGPTQGTAGTDSTPLADGDIQALERILGNPQTRAALLQALKEASTGSDNRGDAATTEDPGRALDDAEQGLITAMTHHLRASWSGLINGARLLDSLPQLWFWLEMQTQPDSLVLWGAFIWQFGLAISVGLIGRWLAAKAIQRPGTRVDLAAEGLPIYGRWALLPVRLLLNMLPVGVFALATNLTLPLIDAGLTARVIAGVAVVAFVLARAVQHVARVLFLPSTQALAVLPISPETGAYLYLWVRRLSTVAAIGVCLLGTLDMILVPQGVLSLTRKAVGLVEFGLVALIILQNRRTLSSWLRIHIIDLGGGSRAAKAVGRLAEVWHILALVYATALFLMWFLEVPGGFAFATLATIKSLATILVAWMISRVAIGLLDKLFTISEEMRLRHPGLERRANSYLSVLKGGVTLVLILFAAIVILESWGADSLDWVSGPLGQRLIGGVLSIALVVAIGLVVWEAVVATADRFLRDTDEKGNTIELGQRVRTLVPLARTVILIILILIISLIVLSELGVNIGPLLAGAGVLGLAISFGSQKLVQDVITGAFCLIEDAIAVGDVVTVAGHSGVVEGLSIRSIRLRDLTGSVHTIPFSTVDTVTNMTKDFSYYVMEIGVAYREDTDHVCEVLRQVDDDLRTNPEYAKELLEPLEILGVDQFADSAVIIKARLKTRPIKQWFVGREFNRLMKKAFDAEGIEIPFPHTTLYFGVDQKGEAPPAYLRMDPKWRAPRPEAGPPPPPSEPEQGAPVDLPDADGR
ncbi:MAG: mechanosensitive ion channel [Rhodospirillum sp.]|nr:mechanosensitive ion channel [Rhodospirillum sp.]MCF8488947.1 mechanosensitive ion channel [Rhodospirillum sp.]MCF8499003.1 mechanosensitive ion channel [Rhodospirillum sp.]